ncbi:hypothetical protein [Actibacterium lipolyticum]|uniref:hypothetical protein n=1 Tax=Actibacterium lipolyticum TaxID=1524263 RepID=UPI000BB45814|nr:hypothetical protein [Actibacterium lipolyticum]
MQLFEFGLGQAKPLVQIMLGDVIAGENRKLGHELRFTNTDAADAIIGFMLTRANQLVRQNEPDDLRRCTSICKARLMYAAIVFFVSRAVASNMLTELTRKALNFFWPKSPFLVGRF